MPLPNDNFISGIHPYQLETLKAFDSGKYQYYFTEWARRHRKTTLWLNVLIREACKHHSCAYGLLLPLQTEARNVVWDSPDMLCRYLPDKKEMDWELNEQKMLVKFSNGSILKIGGADDPDSWRGIEFVGIVFDEAKHIKETMWTTIIRPVMAGPLPPEKVKAGIKRWAGFCYTPEGSNWVTVLMDKACMLGEGGELPDCGKAKLMRPGSFASRLDAEKAGVISTEELQKAKEDMPPTMYQQEMLCSRLSDEERTLITSFMLNELNAIDWSYKRDLLPEKRRIVSIDPAFEGDICSMRGMENKRTLPSELEHHHPTKTEEIIIAAKLMARRIETKNFIIDSIGIGKGVADGLACDEAGYNVQFFNSAESAMDDSLYANKRAEAYAYAAREIRLCKVEPITEPELLRQLPIASRYTSSRGGKKLILIPKKEIKKVLGCSPDDADSYVMGLYGLQFVRAESKNIIQFSKQVKVPSYVRCGVA
jgi:hypothetical protein